jgi:hypothetical protein
MQLQKSGNQVISNHINTDERCIDTVDISRDWMGGWVSGRDSEEETSAATQHNLVFMRDADLINAGYLLAMTSTMVAAHRMMSRRIKRNRNAFDFIPHRSKCIFLHILVTKH